MGKLIAIFQPDPLPDTGGTWSSQLKVYDSYILKGDILFGTRSNREDINIEYILRNFYDDWTKNRIIFSYNEE